MSIANGLRPRQAATIDDAGMVELIGKDRISLADECRDRASIGGKSRLESDRRLNLLERGHTLLQLHMQIHCASDGTYSRRANAEFFHCLPRSRHHPGMVRQPQIIVGTEIQHSLSIHYQPGTLCRT